MLSHTKSSPWAILIPLIVAFSVVGVVLLNASNKNASTDIRSHASLASTISQCTSACGNPAYKSIVKDPAKCALNCTALANGTKTCDGFCEENVTTKGGAICKSQCSAWTASSGSSKCSKLCGIDIGDRTNPKIIEFQKQCAVNCQQVDSGRKKCIDAFKQDSSKSNLSKEAILAYLAECRKQFSQ